MSRNFKKKQKGTRSSEPIGTEEVWTCFQIKKIE